MIRTLFLILLAVAILAVPHHELKETPISLSLMATHEATTSSTVLSITQIIMGFFLGPLLFVCTCTFVWFNQRKAAIDRERLKRAEEFCEKIEGKYEEEHMQDKKLCYISGQIEIKQDLEDPQAGIKIPAVKLMREVEVYEWRETNKSNDAQKEYKLQWVKENKPNVGNRTNDPKNWFMGQSKTFYNHNSTMAKVTLGQQTLDKLANGEALKLYKSNVEAIQKAYNKTDLFYHFDGDYAIIFSPPKDHKKMSSSMLVKDSNTKENEIGSVRISYKEFKVGIGSMIGELKDNKFIPCPAAFHTETEHYKNDIPKWWCCCMCRFFEDHLTPVEHYHQALDESAGMHDLLHQAVYKSIHITYIIRILGYCFMVASFCLFFSPITTLIGYIPFIGGIISGILFFAILMISILVCIPIFMIVVSFAWVRYHPRVGIPMLIIGLLLIGGLFFLDHMQRASGGGPSHLMNLRTHY